MAAALASGVPACKLNCSPVSLLHSLHNKFSPVSNVDNLLMYPLRHSARTTTLLCRIFVLLLAGWTTTNIAAETPANKSLGARLPLNPPVVKTPAPTKEVKRSRSRKPPSDSDSILLRNAFVAKLYLEALEESPRSFNGEDRIHIAHWLASAHRTDDALKVLHLLAEQETYSLPVQLVLAKTWTLVEDYANAIAQTDLILASRPENKDAMAIRAAALRKHGNLALAIEQHRKLAALENSVSNQIGLAFSLLAAGEKVEAARILGEVRPQDPSQEDELYEAMDSLNRSTSPSIELSHKRFEDSEFNTAKEYNVTAKGTLGDYDLSFSYLRKAADDANKVFTANTIMGGVSANMTEEIKALGKFGTTTLGPDNASAQTVGQVKFNIQAATTKIVINYTQEVLSATSAAILKNIGLKLTSIAVVQPLPTRLTLAGSYARKQYSDGNSANDIQASLKYRLNVISPSISFGYAYQGLSFDHPARNAYFDPQKFTAHQLTLSSIWERDPFYIYLDFIYGNQSFTNNNVDKGDHFVGYSTATAGWNMSRNWTVELNAEWSSSSAINSPGVYSDLVFGGRLAYLF